MGREHPYRVTRRTFITEVGRGVSAVAILGTGVVACATASPPDPPLATGLHIPAYGGNREVGTLDPRGSLELWTGGNSITGGGPYEGYEFRDSLFIQDGADVTFRNCWFWREGNWNTVLTDEGTRVTMEDCEFGNETAANRPRTQLALRGDGSIIRRCLFHSAEDGIAFSGKRHLIEQNHVYNLWPENSRLGPHADCCTTDGPSADVTVRFNNFDAVWHPQSGWPGQPNAALQIDEELGDVADHAWHNNYLNGGNFTMFLRDQGSYSITGNVVTDNIFGPTFQFGHASVDPGTWTIWEGNVDTAGEPVNP